MLVDFDGVYVHESVGEFCAICLGELFQENLNLLTVWCTLSDQVKSLNSHVRYNFLIGINREDKVYLGFLDILWCLVNVERIGRHVEPFTSVITSELIATWIV